MINILTILQKAFTRYNNNLKTLLDLKMSKSEYVSETNIGSVKLADSIYGEESLPPFYYRRTDVNGNIGYYPLEIIRSENTSVQQFEFYNLIANNIYTTDTQDDLSECVLYAQAVKKILGSQNVTGIIEQFNITNSDKFYYDNQNIIYNDNYVHIINNRILVFNSLNDIYESEIIIKDSFINNNIEVIING